MRPWGPKGAVGSHFGRLGGGLGGPRGAFGRHFGGLGVPVGAFGAQSASKTVGVFHGPPLLADFGAQRGPRRVPK